MSDNFQSTMSAEALAGRVGQEIGVSRWFVLDQARIDAFAEVTEDRFFIHTDPARAAAETPWGGTIAHGFLTLSLLSAMAYDAVPGVSGAERSVNYGFDRVRFVAPVPAGSGVRARFALAGLDCARPGEVTLTYDVRVEIRGQEIAAGGRPALAAIWIARHFAD